jgi:hypothetical protein
VKKVKKKKESPYGLPTREVFKMLRDVKRKHCLVEKSLNSKITYPLKPEKIKVNDITISPRKLK